jgi:hypothetical protein
LVDCLKVNGFTPVFKVVAYLGVLVLQVRTGTRIDESKYCTDGWNLQRRLIP